MKVLLTGATSCIGGYVLKQLEANPLIKELVCTSRKYEPYYGSLPAEQRVKRVECHLDKHQWTERLLSEFKPTHVVHIAGNGSQSSTIREAYNDNVVTTMNLLDKSPLGCRFIYLSSIVADILPLNTYGLSKLTGEMLIKHYHEMNKIRGCVVRTCAIVGYGAKRGLLPDLVKKSKQDGYCMNLIGVMPGSVKPFVYAEELARFITTLMPDKGQTDIFPNHSYGPRDNLSVLQVAQIVADILHAHKHINWDNTDNPRDQKWVSMPAGTIISKSNSSEAIKLALRDIMKGGVV